MLGVGYSPEAVITSSTGFDQFLKSGGKATDIVEGKYLIKYPISNSTVIIETDDMGAELLFLYRTSNYWCVSTSLYQLAVHIHSKKLPLTLKKIDLALNFIQTSLFEQPINTNPNFEEIILIESNKRLIASRDSIKIKSKNEIGLFHVKFQELPFAEKVTYFVGFFKKMISTISEKHDINLELSGGIDSRVLFSIFREDIVNKKIKISTDKNRENDYLIVEMLSKLYGFSLTSYEDNNVGKKDFLVKYKLFKYGNIGVSRTRKRPNAGSGIHASTTFRINGGRGGIGKLFYNDNYMAYVNLIKKSHLQDTLKSQVINEFIRVLHMESYQDHPARTMVNLYSKYRMRYFAGRSWYYSLLGIILSPFNSKMFELIISSNDLEEFFNKDIEYIYRKNLIQLYILYLLAPELAFVLTDSNNKDFDIEDISLIKELRVKQEGDIESDHFNFLLYDSEDTLLKMQDEPVYKLNSYDDLIYENIANGFSLLEKFEILNDSYLLELRGKLENKTLTRAEESSLLHVISLLVLGH